jgi:hypothetical protein
MERTMLFIVMAVSIIGAALSLNYMWGKLQCEAIAQEMEVKSRFSLFTGCMIQAKPGEKFMPLRNYRFTEDTE